MQALKHARWWSTVLMVAALPAVFAQPADGQTTVPVTVPGWSDPWLAGMPDGSTASCWPPEGCDVAPAQSPQLVVGLCMFPGELLSFEATGGVGHCGGCTLFPPDEDGVTSHGQEAGYGENGIADVYAPYDCLVGVFLDDTQPDLTPEPPYLDFSTQASRDYLLLSPGLKQPFFIGDGVTSSGATQHVAIPEGATRLFLGTMDSSTWLNNIGQFDVLVTEPCAPTPVLPISWGRIKALHR